MLADATKQFLVNSSKMNDKGTIRMVTQEEYLKYMNEQHQITPVVLKAMAEAERTLFTGMAEVGADDLATLITNAKKAGDDPTDLEASVRISRPSGQLSATVRTERTTINPKTQEHLKQHGVILAKVRTKHMIDPDAANRIQERIAKMMG